MSSRIRVGRRYLVAAVAVFGIAGIASAQVTGFGGSSMTSWTANTSSAGVPSVTGTGTSSDVLTLTTPTNSLATSYFFNTPQSITNFTESFTYQQTSNAPNNGADGFAAVWQNQGATALGAGGGGLGYSPGGGQTTGGITTAAALAINIYSGNVIGSGYNTTVGGGNPVTILPLNGVNVASGDPINVSLNYREADGTLTETMTDATTLATYTRAWRGISIQGQVGATTALVGFTGGTGGVNAGQTITNFQYTPGNAVSTPATIKPIAATGWNQNMIISAANGSANITATMDNGTNLAAGGDTFYEQGVNNPTNNPGGFATAAGVPHPGVFGSANDANHAFQLQPNGPGQNDALMLDSGNTSGTLALAPSGRYSLLSFLTASGQGASNMNVTIHYAGGGTQIASVPAPDWFNAGPIALYANGRVDTAFDDFNQTLGVFPRMFQEDVSLTDTIDAVTSIDFSFGGSGANREVVFGISGTAVPEPSSMALLSLGAIGLLVRRRRAARAK